MLVATGVLLGFVLIVMVGEGVQEMQLAGWIPTTTVDIAIPGWMGTWFALFPTVETLGAQLFAAVFVIGSYFAAEYVKVRRPKRRGETVARRAALPPETVAPLA
jgi:high-affinity iron transporter